MAPAGESNAVPPHAAGRIARSVLLPAAATSPAAASVSHAVGQSVAGGEGGEHTTMPVNRASMAQAARTPLAHQTLDRAVLDAYGWPHDLTDEQILERLLALNLERPAAQGIAVSPAAQP